MGANMGVRVSVAEEQAAGPHARPGAQEVRGMGCRVWRHLQPPSSAICRPYGSGPSAHSLKAPRHRPARPATSMYATLSWLISASHSPPAPRAKRLIHASTRVEAKAKAFASRPSPRLVAGMLNRRKEAHKRETETGEGEGERGRERERDRVGRAARQGGERSERRPARAAPARHSTSRRVTPGRAACCRR